MPTQNPAQADVLRRPLLPRLAPAIVLVATLTIIGFSAWPTLRPVPTVSVVQAVADPTSVAPTLDAPGAQPEAQSGAIPTRTVQAPGWLEADPFFISVGALTDGFVKTMDVLAGQAVRKGDILGTLVPDDAELALEGAQADVAIRDAELGLAKAELTAAQEAWEHPTELTRAVDAGRAEVAARRAELDQLPALVAEAEALLLQREEERTRTEASAAKGAATDIELVIARQQTLAQRARVDALRARRPMLDAALERARAQAHAAERNLELRTEDRRRLAEARASLARAQAALQAAHASRAEAQLRLDRMVVRSPMDGYVQSRDKGPGDKVMRMMDNPHSADLVHLYDPANLQVRVDVPLADAAHIRVGQPCEIVVEVLPDHTFSGVVLRSTHEADLQKNTLQFKVRIQEPLPILRPEMLARVKFLGADDTPRPPQSGEPETTSRVLVPTDALDQGRLWLVVDRHADRGTLRATQVTPIDTRDAWTLIEGPVRPGALLALAPAQPRDGRRVRFRAEPASVALAQEASP